MTDSEFLVSIAGRLHYEPGDARRLMEIAHTLRQLVAFADATVRDAIREAREGERQAAASAAADLHRVCREHRR